MPERLALVGAGVIGRRHIEAIGKTEKADLVAIVDPHASAQALAAEFSLPHFTDTATMLGEIDPAAVIIASPTEHHLAPAVAALNHGCHVLVEKPIAAEIDDAKKLIALSEAKGLAVLVGHHRRYYPNVEKARALVQGGALGQLVAVSGQWCVRKHDSYYDPDWRKRWQSGPVLINLVHDLDSLRYILGEIDSVQAELSNTVQGFEKEDAVAVILRFASGVLGTFLMSDQADSPWAWEFATGENPSFPRNGENCVRFVGTKGALEFPNLRLWTSSDGAGSWQSRKTFQDFPMELGDAYVRQIEHLVDVIASKAEPKINATDATQSLRATLAVLDAARTGGRVTV